MPATGYRLLLNECVSDLERSGFAAERLKGRDLVEIGAAVVWLARKKLDESPEGIHHPLGFARIPLTPWRLDCSRIAIHVWDQRSTLTLSDDIHDHCYDFVSLCHHGGLEHRIYEVTNDACAIQRATALHYAAGSCEGAGGGHFLDEVRILPVDAFRISAPQVYAMRHDVLHSASPVTDLTVSVQFQSPCRKAEARVYRAVERQHREKWLSGESFTYERLASALARIA